MILDDEQDDDVGEDELQQIEHAAEVVWSMYILLLGFVYFCTHFANPTLILYSLFYSLSFSLSNYKNVLIHFTFLLAIVAVG